MKKVHNTKNVASKKPSEKAAKKHANQKALKKLAKQFSLGRQQFSEGHYEAAHTIWFEFYHAVAALHEFPVLSDYIETSWGCIQANKSNNFLTFFENFLDRYCRDIITLLEKLNNSSFIEGRYCTTVKLEAPLIKTIDKHGEYLFIFAKQAIDQEEFQKAADFFEQCISTFDQYIDYLSNDSESEYSDMVHVAKIRQATCHCYIIHCLNNLKREDLNPSHGEKLSLLHASFKDFTTNNVYFSGLYKSTIALMATFFPAAFSKGTDSNLVSLLGKKSLGVTRLLHGIEKGEEGFENIAFPELISALRRAVSELQDKLSLNGLSMALTQQYGYTLYKLKEVLFRCHALLTEDEDFSQNFGEIVALSRRHKVDIAPLTHLIFHYTVATWQLNENNFFDAEKSLSIASTFSENCKTSPFHLFMLVVIKIQHCLIESNFDLFINLLPEARILFSALIPNYKHFPHLIKTLHLYLSTLNFALSFCYILADISEGDLRACYIKMASLAHQEMLYSTKSIKKYYPDETLVDEVFTFYSAKFSIMIANNHQQAISNTASLMPIRSILQYFTDFLNGIKTVLLADHCSLQCLEDSLSQIDWIKSQISRIIAHSQSLLEISADNLLKFNTADHFKRLTHLSVNFTEEYIRELKKLILPCEKLQLRIDAHYYKASLKDSNIRLPARYNRGAVGLNDQEISLIKRSNSTHNFFAFFDGEIITEAAIAPKKHHINPRIYSERKGPGN